MHPLHPLATPMAQGTCLVVASVVLAALGEAKSALRNPLAGSEGPLRGGGKRGKKKGRGKKMKKTDRRMGEKNIPVSSEKNCGYSHEHAVMWPAGRADLFLTMICL